MLFWQIKFIGYSLDTELIPRRTTDVCPSNKPSRVFQQDSDSATFHTCSCEDHCSWDSCFLHHPPEECLSGTGSKWYWDSRMGAWVAQLVEGKC